MASLFQNSLFDTISTEVNENSPQDLFAAEKPKAITAIKVDVVNTSSFDNVYELFEGFNHLKLITYSSDVGLMLQLADYFEDVEFIFGNESVMGKAGSYFIEQYALCKGLHDLNQQKDDSIIKRIKDGSFRIFVTKLNGCTSHQKLFLLSNDKNEYRVITGSANLSKRAFSGKQRETVEFAEGINNYSFYLEEYNKTKEQSTYSVAERSVKLVNSPEDFENIPIIQSVLTTGQLAVEQMEDVTEAIDEYVIPKQQLEAFFEQEKLNPDSLLTKSKTPGYDVIVPDKVKKFSNKMKAAVNKRLIAEKDFPRYYYDKSKNCLYFYDEPISTADIDDIAVRKDISILLEYFNSFYNQEFKFKGNIESNVCKYYATLNFALAAPFISVCRAETYGTNIEVIPYPLYVLLRGNTNAGKSMLMSTILKAMFNNMSLNIDGPNGLILKSKEEANAQAGLRDKMIVGKGLPLMVDEVPKDRWKTYCEGFIKNDDRYSNYSPIIFASNDVDNIPDAIGKRVAVFDIDITTPRDSNLIRKNICSLPNEFTGAFFKLYQKCMLEHMEDFLDSFHVEENNVAAPDLMKLSSEILLGIIEKYAEDDTYKKYAKVYDIAYYLTKANKEETIRSFQEQYSKFGDTWTIDYDHDKVKIEFPGPYDGRNFKNKYGEDFIEWHGTSVCFSAKEAERRYGVVLCPSKGIKGIFSRIFNKAKK